MKVKKKIIILSLIAILTSIILVLFSTVNKSDKLYSPDKQYSVYSKTYLWSEIMCGIFSTMGCNYSGKIYLYDEMEKHILESEIVDNLDSEVLKNINWNDNRKASIYSISKNGIEFYYWNLPRPLKLSGK